MNNNELKLVYDPRLFWSILFLFVFMFQVHFQPTKKQGKIVKMWKETNKKLPYKLSNKVRGLELDVKQLMLLMAFLADIISHLQNQR